MEANPPSMMQRLGLPRYGPWVALASVALILGWYHLLRPRLAEREARVRATEELQRFAGCLQAVGAEAGYRDRLIGADASGGDWPGSCRRHAVTAGVFLSVMLRHRPRQCTRERCCPGDAQCQATAQLVHLLEGLVVAIGTSQLTVSRVRSLVDVGRRAGLDVSLGTGAMGTAPEPAKPLRPLAAEALSQAGTLEALPSPAGLLLLRTGASACSLRLDRAEASCRPWAAPSEPAPVPSAALGPVRLGELAAWIEPHGDKWLLRGDDGLSAPLPARPTSLDVCHTARERFVLARFEPSGHAARAVVVRRSGATHEVELAAPAFGFGCHGEAASLLTVELEGRSGSTATHRVERRLCTPAGCTVDRANVTLRHRSAVSPMLVGDLGSAMLVLWRSPLGDVRMRLAPLSELARAPSRVLFDDAEHGGFYWDTGSQLYVREGAGVLVTHAGPAAHRYAIRVAASGEVRTYRVR